MNRSRRLELYEKLYIQEVERREKIQARLNLPLAILLALLGLVSFLVQNIPVFNGLYAYFFWLFFTGAVIAILVSLFFFHRCLHKYLDCLVSSPAEMEIYYLGLKDHHAQSPNAKKLTDNTFRDFLLNMYKDAGTKNGKNNDGRSHNLYLATLSITIAILFTLLSLVPFYLAGNLKPTTEAGSLLCPEKIHHRHHHRHQLVTSEVMFQIHHQPMSRDRPHHHHDSSAVLNEKLTEN